MAQRVIGIDFGTSTSVIRVKRYDDKGKPLGERLDTKEVVFGGQNMVPSMIRKIEGHTYYGYEALPSKRNSVLCQNFKIDLENPDMGMAQEAREKTEEFFNYMAKRYFEQRDGSFLGEVTDTERTIVSYPVKWGQGTRKFILDSAKKAGFKNVEGMDEAQAAIHSVFVQNADFLSGQGYFQNKKPVNILLIDMGAGTTDLVVCRYTPGIQTSEILCTWPKGGDILFGGQEVEQILRDYIKNQLPTEEAELVLKKCGVEKFKNWKETLVSPALKREETVREFSELDDILDILGTDMKDLELDRTAFEEIGSGYLSKFPELVNGCIENAGLQGSDIDLVILTGGHSQWYFVKEMIARTLTRFGEINLSKIRADKNRIIQIARPQETVALGMVYDPLVSTLKWKEPEIKAVSKPEVQVRVDVEEKVHTGESFRTEKNILQDGFMDVASRISLNWDSRSIVLLKPDGSIWSDDTSIQSDLENIRGITALGYAKRTLIQKDRCLECDKKILTLKNDGWENIRDITPMRNVSYSSRLTRYVGITNDNRVIFSQNKDERVLTWISSKWDNIKKIVYIQDYEDKYGDRCDIAAALCKNGKVLVSSWMWQKAADWENIVDICHVFCGAPFMGIGNVGFLIGLREDGKVMVAKNEYRKFFGRSHDTISENILEWKNILSIAGGGDYVAGLCQDGTVALASPSIVFKGEEVKNWRNIVAIAGDDSHLVGLQRDGRVVAVGSGELVDPGACDVKGWDNIVAIVADGGRTAGVKRDGTVIYTGSNLKHIKSGLFKLKEEWIYEAFPPKTTPVSIFA